MSRIASCELRPNWRSPSAPCAYRVTNKMQIGAGTLMTPLV